MNSQKSSELVTVLPALNEAITIISVIESLRGYGDVVVVDDGSTDGTGICSAASGAFVVTHDHNLGYDKALESGLLWAVRHGYRYAITIDADGQHSPTHINSFIRELETGADLVSGVRDNRQRWAESIFALISRRLWGINDPLCGMKGYRLDLILAEGYFNTYPSVGTEFLIRAARSSCKINQVHIFTSARNGESRFGGGLRPNLKILRAIWLGIFRARGFSGV